MGDAALNVSSQLYEYRSSMSGYFSLGEENQQLMDENIQLRTELVQIRRQLEAIQAHSAEDSVKLARIEESPKKEEFTYLTARVIKLTTHHSYNYITLDKGIQEGVQIGMGVVSPKGIVGKVVRVTEDYSLVLSALNVDFKLSLKAIIPVEGKEARESGNIGFFEWKKRDPRYADLTYIPETVQLDTGYQVVTSGYSTVFPPGYKVGKISWLEPKAEDGFYRARIQLATDFNDLGNVYLIQAKHAAIMDSLAVDLPRDE